MTHKHADDILLNSYTKTEAKELRDKYRHLEGNTYAKDSTVIGTIRTVCIAPYDGLNKWLFFSFYKEHKDLIKALEHYSAPYYDVVLIIQLNEGQLVMKELTDYIKENSGE